MPRRLRLWIDPFAALQDLRAFVTARCRAAWRRLATAPGPDHRVQPFKLELHPMDWRNPPSETIGGTVLPLAATAAAAAAAVYFATTFEARAAHAGAGAAGPGTDPLGYDTSPALVLPVALEPDPGAPGPSSTGPGPAPDGAGSTLRADPEEPDPKDAPGEPGASGTPETDGGTFAGIGGGGATAGGTGSSAPGGTDGSAPVGGFDGGSGLGGAGTPNFYPRSVGVSGGTGGAGTGTSNTTAADPAAPGAAGAADGTGAGGAGQSAVDGGPPSGVPAGRAGAALKFDTSTQPVRFVRNAGQWADGLDFVARGAGYQVAVARDSATVALARTATDAERERFGGGTVFDALRLEWAGASPDTQARGEGQLDSVSNYLIGSDSKGWHTGVAEYAAVRYADLWAGVDLVYRGAGTKQIEYDLVVKPGAAPDEPGFTVRGADARVDEKGQLVLTTAAGTELVQSAPVVYQTAGDGAREPVTGAYRLRADGSVGFAVGAYDPRRELVIDPVLVYTTNFGGSGTDVAYGVASDIYGSTAAAVGYTESADFPTTAAFDATLGSTRDAFVTRLGPTGTLVWSTYLGGGGAGPGGSDEAHGVAFGGGYVYVTGQTGSTNFPVTPGAYQTAPAFASFSYDAFLTALMSDGSGLVYSTHLGGTGPAVANGVAVDWTGEAVVVGYTGKGPFGADFPTLNAAQGARGGVRDAFVTRFNAAGSGLVFSTFLGGSASSLETAYGVGIETNGAINVVGVTDSSDFPVPISGYDRTFSGGSDAFVMRYTASGAISTGTLFGGSGGETGYALGLDNQDRVYVTGSTTSTDLPTRNPVQAASGGGQDAFVAKFTSLTYAPDFATYQGGGGTDAGYGIEADTDWRAVVTGTGGAVVRYNRAGTAIEFTGTGSGLTTGYAVATGGNEMYAAGAGPFANAVVVRFGDIPAPVITGFADDTGSSNTDRLTYDTTPTINGIGPSGATISVYRRRTVDALPALLGTTTATVGGLWTYTYSNGSVNGAYVLTATATSGGLTSVPSNPLTFTLDTTPPAVAVAVATQTYDRRPPVAVTASDLYGLSAAGTVVLDVDLNGDNDYLDAGEANFASGVLTNGAVTFDSYATYLTVGVTAHVRARALDLAGNEGTSAPQSVLVSASPATWAAVSATPALRSGYAGAYGWTTVTDALVYAGNVTASVALDLDVSTTACGCQDPYLVYNSQEAAPAPTVQVRVQSDNALGVPTQVLGTLTWDGVAIGTVAYDLSAVSPGGEWVFGMAPATNLGTGRHTYALDLFVDFPGTINDVSRSVTGQTFLVDRSGSAYGAGWSFSNTDALVPVAASGAYPAGLLRLYGKGGWAFYASAGGSAYTSPPGDAGTLAAVAGGWRYTGWDGKVLAFDSSGRMTTWTSADGTETMTYTYDGAGAGTAMRVATMAGPDGGVATFSYTGGLASSVLAPGARTTTFTLSGSDLVTVTDPGAKTHTFVYTAHRLATETENGAATAYSYSNGLARTVSATVGWGTITAALATGVGKAGTVTGGGVRGDYTDARGNATVTAFNTFGQPLQRVAPDGGTEAYARDANGYVTGYTDQLNRVTAYTVNARGQVTQTVRPDLTVATVAYGGANGALSAYTDPRGGLWTYTSDVYGRQTAAKDPLGRVTTYTYAAGLLQTAVDPLGNVTTYLYDAARRPVGALVGGAVTGTIGYDAAGNAVTWTDALGKATTTGYDGAGRVTGVTDALGKTTTSTYAASGQLLSTTDPLGNVTSYVYDVPGNVIAVIEGYGTGLARRTTSVYDAAGNRIASIDPLGHRTTTVLDALNRAVAIIDAMGNVSTTVYDLSGQVVATVDALGRVTRPGYDALGQQVTITDAMGNVSTTVYDADSHVIATVDPLGHRSTSTYDGAGQMIASVDPLGKATSYGYDGAGRRVTATDPRGNVTTTQYDARGRAEATIDALGKRTTSVYDPADRVTATVDPLGNRTSYAYDAAGRVFETKDALGKVTTTVYDAAGHVIATVDPLGNRTTTVYDALNRVVATQDALGKYATTVYDAADRVLATVDALGNRTTYMYDDLNRVTTTQDPLGNQNSTRFDAVGNVVRTFDASGRAPTMTYDGLDRLITTTDPLGAVSTVSYDAAGHQVAATDPLGRVTTATYDDADRVTEVIDALGNRTTTVYDAAGNVIATVDALGRRATSTFDVLNRVVTVQNALNQVSTVVYDAAGNVISVTDALNHTTTSTFDALNRISVVTDARGKSTTTSYDAAGNVISVTDPLNHTTTWLYDRLNRASVVTDARGKSTTTSYDAVGNVISVTDPLNRVTTFGYDARNLPVMRTDPAGNVWTTQYDGLGRGWRQIDPLGHDTRIFFDAAGRAVESYDAAGGRRTTVLDGAGNAIASVDPLGNRTTVSFDALDRPVGTQDALGFRSTSLYDAVGNVTVTVDALNRRTTTAFDALNRVMTVKDARNGVSSTTYDAAGNVATRTDPLGHTTSYGYDTVNRVVITTNALGKVVTTAYDDVGNLISSTDPLSHTTTWVYDQVNRRVETIDPLNNRTTSVYDAAGQPSAWVDELGNRTSYVYDPRGLVQTVTDPFGKVTTSVYDAAGNRTAVINARGYVTTSTYDALNRVIATTDALGNRTTRVYDAAGNAVAMIDPLGYRATNVYDQLNQVIATVNALGNRATTGYDAVGNIATRTDGLNRATSYGYDELNRAITETDPRGFTTTIAYDAVGNQVGLIDAVGNRTTWAYDADDRVTSEINPFGASKTYAYDAAGRQTSQMDRLGQRRDYAFDDTNRVLTEKWYAVGGALTQTQTWTYDGAGNMLTALDPDGAYTLTYDALNRVTTVREPFSLTLTMGYDAVGNRTSVQDSKNGYTTVTFDALNRQTSEQTAGTGISAIRFDYAYTARGEVASFTRYSNLPGTTVVGTTTHDYDAAGRETHLKSTNGAGTVLANYTYTYDAAGQVTTKQENGTTTIYSYDATAQLTADGAATYGYDETGNRTNAGYVAGSGNRMTSDGIWTYTYDANGNVIKRSKGVVSDTWAYGFDNRNQMTSAAYSATDGGIVTQRVTYVYDALGNRIERDAWNGTTSVERYAMDGWDPAKLNPLGTENFDTWADLDNANALTMRRAFGTGFDELIARQASDGTVMWYLADNQQSVRQLINNVGGIAGTLTYSAFGQTTVSSGTSDRYEYTGQEIDSTLNLYLYNARIYDHLSGRFFQEDPLGFAAGDANLFRYVKNSSTNATDPSGLQPTRYYPQNSPLLKDAAEKLLITQPRVVGVDITDDGKFKLRYPGFGGGIYAVIGEFEIIDYPEALRRISKAKAPQGKMPIGQNPPFGGGYGGSGGGIGNGTTFPGIDRVSPPPSGKGTLLVPPSFPGAFDQKYPAGSDAVAAAFNTIKNGIKIDGDKYPLWVHIMEHFLQTYRTGGELRSNPYILPDKYKREMELHSRPVIYKILKDAYDKGGISSKVGSGFSVPEQKVRWYSSAWDLNNERLVKFKEKFTDTDENLFRSHGGAWITIDALGSQVTGKSTDPDGTVTLRLKAQVTVLDAADFSDKDSWFSRRLRQNWPGWLGDIYRAAAVLQEINPKSVYWHKITFISEYAVTIGCVPPGTVAPGGR
ncbi:RHS repeat protein [Gemmata sp. G18]|uniref:RHS repeat protein n=1 Tax=Gemmata palustris TaxID=2822762 RepID=A0ABS5BVU4_9BACT|nr:RHS repeat-associated core domain-containing protein [Gemmata palustris]MBP3957828.1 RHS repeat protein [Gemmata palustris]